MSKRLLIGLILLFLVIVQSALLDYVKIFNVKPDIVLIAVILIALSLDFKSVIAYSYLAGIFKDVFSSCPLALNIFVLPLVGFCVFRLSKKIELETNFARATLVFFSVVFENIIFAILLFILEINIPLNTFLRFSVFGSFYTVLIFLLAPKIFRIPNYLFTIK